MKLIHAHIKNFRLLKDLELDFSTDTDKPLTVIRAANESGKTTAETALIWGLYGSEALPSKGKKYPLSPSDAFVNNERKVEISVEIEFETEGVISIGKGKQILETIRYRLLRQCTEYPSPSEYVQRDKDIKFLHKITDAGVKRTPDAQIKSIIESSIPEALKDVYFTDGDSAMSFIEAAASQKAKRDRVKNAIEALLGLQILEQTEKHLDSAIKKFESKSDNTDYKKKVEKINDQLDGYREDIEEWSEELKDKESEINENTQRLRDIEQKIEEILTLGDKKKLVKDIQNCKSHIKSNQDSAERALKELSSLMRNPTVAASMLMKPANKGLSILKKLHEKKQLPKVNIPILEELLDRTSCFCGADLSENTQEGKERSQSIVEAIEKSRDSDELQESASSLFFSVRSEPFNSSIRDKWIARYSVHCENYEQSVVEVNNLKSELKEKEEEKDKIKDDVLQEYRQQEKTLKIKLKDAQIKVGSLSTNINNAENRRSDLKGDKLRAENKLNKEDTSKGKLKLSRLTRTVFRNIYDFLRKNEVERVSQEMNRIFLDMIGADPDANPLATITKAELTEEFDILVYGSNGHKLNPDQDLNGASRRAITLAFILALTKVSEVKAPNVIDTPLGMMSGYVKQSVLNKTLEEGTQIILFLTHDEIQGVENILDNKAGKVYTLTNPAHSKMLVNQPTATNIGVFRCECDHRKSCQVCARKNIQELGN